MSYKLLDSDGLTRLWTKIKNTFVPKSYIGDKLCPLESGIIPYGYLGNYNLFQAPEFGKEFVLNTSYNVVVLSDCSNVSFIIEPNYDVGVMVLDVYTPMATTNIPFSFGSISFQYKNFSGSVPMKTFLPKKSYHLVIDFNGIIYIQSF